MGTSGEAVTTTTTSVLDKVNANRKLPIPDALRQKVHDRITRARSRLGLVLAGGW